MTQDQNFLQDFRTLHSMTKYPSIENFHKLGKKGRLMDELTAAGRMLAGRKDISVTEKIDGTSARTIVLSPPDFDWFLGARENLLVNRHGFTPEQKGGSRPLDPTEKAICAALSNQAEKVREVWAKISRSIPEDDSQRREAILVVYEEVYGGNIGGGAKNYTKDGSVGHRAFDIRSFSFEEFFEIHSMPLEKIAGMRERGVLPCRWFSDEERLQFCKDLGLEVVPLLGSYAPIPESVDGAYAWLKEVAGEKTKAAIGKNVPGYPEGVVVRLPDHSAIAKLRFDEYERTLGIR